MQTTRFYMLAVAALLPVLAGCVTKGKYDEAVRDAATANARLMDAQDAAARRAKDDKATIDALRQRIADAERDAQVGADKIAQLSTSGQNLQASLDEATSINLKLRKELERLGKDVDKVLAEKGTLAKSLDEARARLEELRKAQAAAEARAKLLSDFVKRLKGMVDAGQLKIVVRRGRLVLQLPTDVLFDSGQSVVKPAGRTALAQVAQALRSVPERQFQVAGHTDNVPVGGGSSNWELSTERAVHVVKILLSNGVSASQVSAAGYGEFDPVAANDTTEGKAKNRRIEITLQPNIDELVAIPNVD